MSENYYIKTKRKFNFQELIEVTYENEDMLHEQRAENLVYYWVEGASARGVDLTMESSNWIEIRNTACSNSVDYQLTNYLADLICEIFNGEIYKDNDDFEEDDDSSQEYLLIEAPLYTKVQMLNNPIRDFNIVKTIVQHQKQTITLFGPHSSLYIGSDVIHSLGDKTDEEVANALEGLMLYLNYHLSQYEYGNIMKMGEGEDQKTLKLLTNTSDIMIDQYDYILLKEKDSEDIVAITNKDLNQILPKNWKRIDEYHIVAPILEDEDFENLIEDAQQYNRYQELFNE